MRQTAKPTFFSLLLENFLVAVDRIEPPSNVFKLILNINPLFNIHFITSNFKAFVANSLTHHVHIIKIGKGIAHRKRLLDLRQTENANLYPHNAFIWRNLSMWSHVVEAETDRLRHLQWVLKIKIEHRSRKPNHFCAHNEIFQTCSRFFDSFPEAMTTMAFSSVVTNSFSLYNSSIHQDRIVDTFTFNFSTASTCNGAFFFSFHNLKNTDASSF